MRINMSNRTVFWPILTFVGLIIFYPFVKFIFPGFQKIVTNIISFIFLLGLLALLIFLIGKSLLILFKSNRDAGIRGVFGLLLGVALGFIIRSYLYEPQSIGKIFEGFSDIELFGIFLLVGFALSILSSFSSRNQNPVLICSLTVFFIIILESLGMQFLRKNINWVFFMIAGFASYQMFGFKSFSPRRNKYYSRRKPEDDLKP